METICKRDKHEFETYIKGKKCAICKDRATGMARKRYLCKKHSKEISNQNQRLHNLGLDIPNNLTIIDFNKKPKKELIQIHPFRKLITTRKPAGPKIDISKLSKWKSNLE